MITLDLSILNQKGTPMFNSDLFANRPAAGIVGRIFISTDTNVLYRDNGTTWDLIGGGGGGGTISGSIANTQVAFGTTTNTIGGSNDLTYDNTNDKLSLITSGQLTRGFYNTEYSTGVSGAINVIQKARGTVASPTNVLTGDLIGGFSFSARVAGAFTLDRSLFGANMSSTTGIGMYFITGSTDANYAPSMYIHPTGNVSINPGGSVISGSITDTGQRLQVTGNAIFTLNQNAGTQFTVSNTTSGSLSACQIQLISDTLAGAATFAKYSTTTNTYKILVAKDAYIYNNTGGDIAFLNDFSTGRIKWAAGGSSTPQVSLFPNGNLLINSTTDNTYKLQVTGNQAITDTQTYVSGVIHTLVASRNTTFSAGSISGSTGICNFVGTGDNIINGNLTVPNTTSFAGIYQYNKYQFGAAGLTFTVTQASPGGLRAVTQLFTQNVFKGSNSGTITHMAGLQIGGFYSENSGTITPIIPNVYQLLINDTGAYLHTFTFTNRWGIYQEGINDRNYLAGNLLLNSTVDTGQILQVNGAIRINGQASATAGGSSGNHLIINVDGTQYKIALLNP